MNEKTQVELARLFLDYSINKKIINGDYIDKLIEIVVNGKELKEYVKDYKIDNKTIQENNIIANYDASTKIINLYWKELYNYLKESMEYMYLFTETETHLYLNLIATQIILHEIEHANQLKIMDKENNIESRILKLCEFEEKSEIEALIKRGKISEVEAYLYRIQKMDEYIEKYYKYYLYVPHERLAEIKTYQEIIDTLYVIKEHAKNIIKFEESNKLASALRGYNNDSYSPTITYLTNQDRIKDLKEFDWYSDNKEETIKLSKEKYNLKDRMKYGLPIDEHEHQFVKEIFLDTIKF